MPVMIVGRRRQDDVKARRSADLESARDVERFLAQAATPNAVLISIGQSEQMKMTKIAESAVSLMV